MTCSIELPDLSATEQFGRQLGHVLTAGTTIALNGPLGAGKTHLVRAIAEGLNVVNPALVNSPTFVLIQEYPARLPIYHFDAYRLNGPAEFESLGTDEYFQAGGVCLVEWAEKVASSLPEDRLEITIAIIGSTARRLTITAGGPNSTRILESLDPLESSLTAR